MPQVRGDSGGPSTPEYRSMSSHRGRMGRTDDDILATTVGLRIASQLAFARWEQAGLQIARVSTASAWCLGDWLVYGQQRFSGGYRQAVEALGLDYQTLRNYAWVTRAFEMSRRREGLSFQHHAEVAALPRADQDRWLDRAEAAGWSKSQLRMRLRGSRTGTAGADGRTSLLPRFRVPAERIAQWRVAAARSCRDLDQWMTETLDAAASAVLRGGPDDDRPDPATLV